MVLCVTTPCAAVIGYLLIKMWVVFRVFTPSGVFGLLLRFGGKYCVHLDSHFVFTWTRVSRLEERASTLCRNVGTKQVHYTVKDPKDCNFKNSRGEKLNTCTLSGDSMFCSENEGGSFFRNVGSHLRNCKVSWPKRPQCVWLVFLPFYFIFGCEKE